jgi:iron complex outermembrane receptor protein
MKFQMQKSPCKSIGLRLEIISMRILFILIIALCSQNIIEAQQTFEHDTVEFSSLVVPLKIKETGRSVTVLTKEEIAKISATSIDEILQTISGIEVQSRGGFGVQADILMRGSTFTQVLILIDGMKLNDPLTSHFNGNIPVSLAEIEKIEVLRGAASTMYGSDAVGGVINIITKTFSKNSNKDDHTASVSFGSNKSVATDWGFHQSNGKLRIGGGVSLEKSDGEYFEERILDQTTLEAYNTFFDNKRLGFSLAYDLSEEYKLRFRSSYDNRDFGARYFYTSSVLDKGTEEVSTWWNRMQISKVGEKSSSDFNVAYKYTTDEFVFSPDFPSTNNHTTQFLNFTYNNIYIVNDNFSFAGGMQFDNRQIKSNDRGNHSDLHHGLYLMGNFNKEALNINLSLRGDYDENFEFELTPGFNISYVKSRFIFRASAGRSIRAADYTERYVSNNLSNLTPGRNLGNPELLAERSWSQEIGVDVQISNKLSFSTTGYLRQSDNLIDYVSTNENEIGSVSDIGTLQADADYFFAKNITSVNTSGIEAFANYNSNISDNTFLSIDVGYNYTKTTNDEDIISVYISSHARQLFTLSSYLKYRRLTIGFNGLYKERNERIANTINSNLSPNYFVIHSRIGLDLGQGLSASIDIRNLLDESYANILGAEMPGRWFMAGMNWRM